MCLSSTFCPFKFLVCFDKTVILRISNRVEQRLKTTAVAVTASVLITFDRKVLTCTSLHTEDCNYSGEERTQSSFEGMQ